MQMIIEDLREEKKILEEAHNKLRANVHSDTQEREAQFERGNI